MKRKITKSCNLASQSLFIYSYEYKLYIEGRYRGSSPTKQGVKKIYDAYCQLAGVNKLDFFIDVVCYEYYFCHLIRVGHGSSRKEAKLDLSY